MSSPTLTDPATPAAATRPVARVRAAIARAAGETGNSFSAMLAAARIESALDPAARARTSTARGLYQFTAGTWLGALARHGGAHGLGWAQAAIAGGLTDPAQRAAILALRDDPAAAALMAGETMRENRASLSAQLGREPDAAELYLAHFLGAAGAGEFLGALAADPAASAAALLPRAAAANRAVFFDGAGAPRSLGAVMARLREKVQRAIAADANAMPADPGAPWPVALAPASPAALPAAAGAALFVPDPAPARAPAPAIAAMPSMAATLAQAFALGAGVGAAAPAHVRAAYGQLAALGL